MHKPTTDDVRFAWVQTVTEMSDVTAAEAEEAFDTWYQDVRDAAMNDQEEYASYGF